MKKVTILMLAILVIIHAAATLFMFGALFAESVMDPSVVDPIESRACQVAFAVLSLPVLWMVFGDSNSLFGTHLYLVSIVNSLLAICPLYYIYLWRRKRKKSLTNKDRS